MANYLRHSACFEFFVIRLRSSRGLASVKFVIDVVILLWLLFGSVASHSFMVTIREMWSKNIRKPFLTRRPSLFFSFDKFDIIEVCCFSDDCHAFYETKSDAHGEITEPLTHWPLPSSSSDSPRDCCTINWPYNCMHTNSWIYCAYLHFFRAETALHKDCKLIGVWIASKASQN